MTAYWLSFRIADDGARAATYNQRYSGLTEAVEEVSTAQWAETSSFIIFESQYGIDVLADAFASRLLSAYDIFILRKLNSRSARAFGPRGDPTIQTLMPYLKKL